jgi:hypothetical protein
VSDLSDATKELPVTSIRFGTTPQSPRLRQGAELATDCEDKPHIKVLNDYFCKNAQMASPYRKLLSLSLFAYGSLFDDLNEAGVCSIPLSLFLTCFYPLQIVVWKFGYEATSVCVQL